MFCQYEPRTLINMKKDEKMVGCRIVNLTNHYIL